MKRANMRDRTPKRAFQSTMRELADSSLERADKRGSRKQRRKERILERRQEARDRDV